VAFDAFISYAHADKPIADAACAALEAANIRCWIAPRDIDPGRDYGEALVEAIEGGKVFVLIFSRNANASPQIKREVERAVSKGLPIIPVRIEDVAPNRNLEYFISSPHWLDAFPPPRE
jgi:TIR domain